MRTLFISDLDGTLLNKNAEISAFTQHTINSLTRQGMNFSIATARTAATVGKMLKNISIHTPVILMNGVCIYDLEKQNYISVKSIPFPSRVYLTQMIKKHQLSGFFYTIDQNRLTTYYEKTTSPHAKKFMEERQIKFQKVFIKVEHLEDCAYQNGVYYSLSDRKEILNPLYADLKKDQNLHIEFYRDVYCENFWYLEVCSSEASKFNAAHFLRTQYHFDKIISFGDNLNDLPLFMASDECYAVSNAKPEIKAKATNIIESNTDDGVAKWLKSHFIQNK